ncbi:MAG: hypothetical protein QNJ87_03910 [Gammaproteobacteria bacterium]|nr:hypothetical protein [Gammaproteobacteria bacterium]MDJ0870891.1 hypothetical protein [Gammaproteobacteria bacterium]MDJ0891221.1 hypothetical protein [Gammaproteobacteria bacterium]
MLLVRSAAIVLLFLSFTGALHGGARAEDADRPGGGLEAETPEQPATAVSGIRARTLVRGSSRRPLDLTLPPEALAPVGSPQQSGSWLYRGLPGLADTGQEAGPLTRMRRALPALLDPRNGESPVRIRGRLLLDQAKDRSPDAVDGGQIIIEVQTE